MSQNNFNRKKFIGPMRYYLIKIFHMVEGGNLLLLLLFSYLFMMSEFLEMTGRHLSLQMETYYEATLSLA